MFKRPLFVKILCLTKCNKRMINLKALKCHTRIVNQKIELEIRLQDSNQIIILTK